jgi:hypothetical protein
MKIEDEKETAIRVSDKWKIELNCNSDLETFSV